MRISARWAWIPLAITVAGAVYLGMIRLASLEAAWKEPQVVREAPKPFLAPPPPVRAEPKAMPEPPDFAVKPAGSAPTLPDIQLPPFALPYK
jgi:hypothetical protein